MSLPGEIWKLRSQSAPSGLLWSCTKDLAPNLLSGNLETHTIFESFFFPATLYKTLDLGLTSDLDVQFRPLGLASRSAHHNHKTPARYQGSSNTMLCGDICATVTTIDTGRQITSTHRLANLIPLKKITAELNDNFYNILFVCARTLLSIGKRGAQKRIMSFSLRFGRDCKNIHICRDFYPPRIPYLFIYHAIHMVCAKLTSFVGRTYFVHFCKDSYLYLILFWDFFTLLLDFFE